MTRRNLIHSLGAAPLALASRPAAAATEKLSGKARLRSAICAYSFRQELQKKTLMYEDLVRMAVDWNVDGLDMTVYWFPNTSDEFLLPLKRLAYRSGVEIYSISVRTDMCQPTPEGQEKQLAEVRNWVDVAAKLGAGHIRVFGGKIPKDATEDQAAGWVVSVLSRAAQYAGSKGVILGLENHGGITEKAERVLQIVQKVDSQWVGVNVDTGNFKVDQLRQTAMLIPYAVNVQVKVNSDWDGVGKLLRDAGYKGYLALEYEDKEPAMTAVPKLMPKLRDLTRKYSA